MAGKELKVLQLQFDRLITFPVALTIRHIIDENSPYTV
jgi:hypothetical protein